MTTIKTISVIGLLLVTTKTTAIQTKPQTLKEMVAQHAVQLGAQYNLDPALIVAIVATESEFNPKALGKAKEIGLMQLHPKFHKNIKFDVANNMKNGVSYLAKIKKTCYNKKSAWFVCYNTGPKKMPKDATKTAYYRKVKVNYVKSQKIIAAYLARTVIPD